MRLPELLPCSTQGPIDVRVRVGQPPVTVPDGGGVHVVEGGTLLIVRGVASYWIGGGAEIIVTPEAGVDERNVRLFLLGSAMGLLLHQRGLLPLHANSVVIDGRAFAFMGPSGSGKSTLAAWFHDRGFAILADDVSVLDFGGPRPAVLPGVARMRLWRDALDRTGRRPAEFSASFAGEGARDKFDIPLDPECTADEAFPLAAIYLLDRGPSESFSLMTGVAAVEAVIANTYRGRFIEQVGDPRRHWRDSIQLAKDVPLFRMERQWGADHLASGAESLLAHARAVA